MPRQHLQNPDGLTFSEPTALCLAVSLMFDASGAAMHVLRHRHRSGLPYWRASCATALAGHSYLIPIMAECVCSTSPNRRVFGRASESVEAQVDI
jgi:hypothetical protein